MYCVVLTIAELPSADCCASTNLFGPFESAEAAEDELDRLRNAYGDRVLYLRSFDVRSSRSAAASPNAVP